MADLRLDLRPEADADLEAIWLYTAETWSIAQANRYISRLYETFETLRQMPTLAREHRQISPPVRLHPSGQHYVVYRVEGTALSVIRILHTRRNWQTLLSD